MIASGGGRATWNDKGYYFAEAGEFAWIDMYEKIAAEVKKQGYIKDDTLQKFTVEQGDELASGYGKTWFGSSSSLVYWFADDLQGLQLSLPRETSKETIWLEAGW